ncbi:MAG: AMP-binding protein [bacterium]
MRPYLIQHLLEKSGEKFPDKICLEEATKKITYEKTIQYSRKAAGMLQSLEISPGEHIGVFMDRSIDQVISLLGVFYAGAVLIIINPILRDQQISHIIKDAEISTIISSQDKIEKNFSLFKNAGINKAIIFQGENRNQFKDTIICDGNWDVYPEYTEKSSGISADTSHIIYTSGSTGQPKGIVISHQNTIDGAKIVSQYTGLRADDRIIGTLPFNFDYGFNQLMNTLYMGATIYLHRFFLPNDLLGVLEKKKITVFAGMSPIWSKIFNPKLTNLSKKYDFSGIRIITNTGGKVPVSTVKKLKNLFSRANIFLMYGLTEAFRSTYLDPSQIDNRPESIGKAVPNVQIMVINKEGRECGPGEEGELVHRGALISKGYWNNPEKTQQVFKPNPLLSEKNNHLETVVFSGDIVKKDKQGFLYFIGRKDNMIKTKGYRVSPSEVEELIYNFDGVAECVVTGYEDNETIKLRAIIQLNDSLWTSKKVLMKCKQEFPFYLVPDDIVLRDSFPLTSNGKIDRKKVIQEHSNG